MTTRYLGDEPCIRNTQVVRYLTENYADADGKPMPYETAQQIALDGITKITKGITVFRSNVWYLGDEAVNDHGGGRWHEIPGPDEEGDEDDGGY